MFQYDFLIVGAGLFGAVFAHEIKKTGRSCLVIDKRPHAGGNVHCDTIDGINVHSYGPHIFHTNDKKIWDYVNSFVEFNRFTYMPVASFKDRLYNLPFNMNTFYQLWKVKTPQAAHDIIQQQIVKLNITSPANLEEQALSIVGEDIYLKLIKGYTEKQWGRSARELPAFIIKRLPVRYTFDNNYFNDKYQGIPVGGYNKLIDGLLEGVECRLNVDYFRHKDELDAKAAAVVFTGAIDEFYNYRFGHLAYRSLRFETLRLPVKNFQGNAVVNYTERKIPYTRIIEHKHFEFGKQPTTVITKEFPLEWKPGEIPYYPVNDTSNNEIYKKYQALAGVETRMLFGGRLAEYRYYDMHQVIASALTKAEKALEG